MSGGCALSPLLSTLQVCNGFACTGSTCACGAGWTSLGDFSNVDQTCLVSIPAIQALHVLSAVLWSAAFLYVLRLLSLKLAFKRLNIKSLRSWDKDNSATLMAASVCCPCYMACSALRVAFPERAAGRDLAASVLFGIAYSSMGVVMLLFVLLIVNLVRANALFKGDEEASLVAQRRSRMLHLYPALMCIAALASFVQIGSVSQPALAETGALFYYIGWGIYAAVLGLVIAPWFFTRLIDEMQRSISSAPSHQNSAQSANIKKFARRLTTLRWVAILVGGGQALPLFLFAGIAGLRDGFTAYQIPVSFIGCALIVLVGLHAMNNFTSRSKRADTRIASSPTGLSPADSIVVAAAEDSSPAAKSP